MQKRIQLYRAGTWSDAQFDREENEEMLAWYGKCKAKHFFNWKPPSVTIIITTTTIYHTAQSIVEVGCVRITQGQRKSNHALVKADDALTDPVNKQLKVCALKMVCHAKSASVMTA